MKKLKTLPDARFIEALRRVTNPTLKLMYEDLTQKMISKYSKELVLKRRLVLGEGRERKILFFESPQLQERFIKGIFNRSQT